MLTHPTLEQLRNLRLEGMAKALEEQLQTPDIAELPFESRLGLMIDRETTTRNNRRMKTRLRKAKLRQGNACIEDVDYRNSRGLDKSVLLSLSSCDWISQHHNVLITGSTGVGKTYLACALAQKACREGYSVQYLRLPRLLLDLALAHADGRYSKLMAGFAKTDLLVLDDWGLAALSDGDRRELLEILEDRHDLHSTVVTSQLPVDKWHDAIDHPTLADAILDRLIHNAYRIPLRGDSLRRKKDLVGATSQIPIQHQQTGGKS
jgi:DNA replication protein DnaC